ncbi:MAG: hypothetical protein M3Z29_14490 [Pseudomonadota bacterium]|nr:hypothetical protein [Pseudomonadota bacterium]
MMKPDEALFRLAVAKAKKAYGKSIVADLETAIEALRARPQRLDRCMAALQIKTVPKALLWKRIKALRASPAERTPCTSCSASGDVVEQRSQRLGHRDVGVVARVEFVEAPSRIAPCSRGELPEHVARTDASAVDVGARQPRHCAREARWLSERLARLTHATRNGPCQVFRAGVGRHRIRRRAPAALVDGGPRHAGGNDVARCLPVLGHEGIQVDKSSNSLRYPVGKIDLRRAEVGPLAQAGAGGGEDLVAEGAHQRAHLLPRPTGRPGAVHDKEGCHTEFLLKVDRESSLRVVCA